LVCQKCGQKPATVFISQTVNNKTTQIHLCEECAGEQTALGGMNPFTVTLDPSSMLKDFFSTLFPGFQPGAEPGMPASGGRLAPGDEAAQCPVCGYRFSLFKQTGRLGCPMCYQSFAALLEPVLASVHGNVRHVEEAAPPAPAAAAGEGALDALKAKLKDAIEHERFEEAALLRDEIHRNKL